MTIYTSQVLKKKQKQWIRRNTDKGKKIYIFVKNGETNKQKSFSLNIN